MRELTKNEKFLLGILGILLVGWGSYKFVIVPQSSKLASFNAQKLEYQEQIDEINMILTREDNIKEDWNILHKEKEEIASRYFPEMDQAQIIYLLNSLLAADKVNIVDMNFNQPMDEEIGEFHVKSMKISIHYNGPYTGIMGVVRSLRNSPRKILLDSISMEGESEDHLNGTISLSIYSLDHIADVDDTVIDIYTEKRESESTPFTSYNGYRKRNSDTNDSSDDLPESQELNPYNEETSLNLENEDTFLLLPQVVDK